MTLFIDMDEVIADTYDAHIEIYNRDFDKQLTREECMGKEVWQCVPKEYQHSIRDHAKTRGFFRDLKPVKDSVPVLKELNKKYSLYIASAAMQYPNSLEEKSEWIDQHLPFIPWQKRILCGDKHILKGDILIDDRSYNLKDFQGRTLLFTSPHNINTSGYERVDNWQQVSEKLL